jgi:hypothetical protein
MKNKCYCLLIITSLFINASFLNAQTWSINQKGDSLVEIGYGSGIDFPQYAALYLKSSYFRMNYGPGSGWGTSVVLLPCLWHDSFYYQGAPITASWKVDASALLISISGTISNLQVEGEVCLLPPVTDLISASVNMNVNNTEALDIKPGEAFKPVMLSSNHVSADSFDCQLAYVNSVFYAIPTEGWINHPPAVGKIFGLMGGTSRWKTNAPTVEVDFGQDISITGWVTKSHNPNDDNVAFWVASDSVLFSWHYTIVAKKIAPLAVEATGFKSTISNGSVTLTWLVESEVNNLGFNIYRKDLGTGSFSMIANYCTNEALRGIGTSTVRRSYSYSDVHVMSGHTYEYTIESVASDGTKKDYPSIQVMVGIPKNYALYQNYPNPFNPETTVAFELPRSEKVAIAIYNMHGVRVATLVEGNLSAGFHKLSWNAADRPSGLYFCRFNAGEYSQTMKLILVK